MVKKKNSRFCAHNSGCTKTHSRLVAAPSLGEEGVKRKRKRGLHSHRLSVDGSASTVASLLKAIK